MKRPSNDTLLVLGLLIFVIAVTSVATYWQTRQQAEQPPLATFSNRPDGARALWLWLEESGYAVSNDTPGFFEPPADADLALILEPAVPGIGEQEWAALDEWVEAGGTLLLAGEGFGAAFSFTHYDFSVSYEVADEAVPLPATPLLASPPLTAAELAPVRPRATLAPAAAGGEERAAPADFVTLLAVDGEPVLVWFEQGEGAVLLSTLTYPFSNAGLKEAGNAEVVLNLLAFAGGSAGQIWFDEWHHGRREVGTAEIAGPTEWVRETPAGRALLYTAVVLFVALALAGWRFGRPVPLPEEQRRRAPLEHITAVANLKRRAGHRQETLATYHRQLKRNLGQRYRLNSALPDEEYLAALAQYRPELDQEALLRLLTRLRSGQVSEGEMVKLAQEVDEWMEGG